MSKKASLQTKSFLVLLGLAIIGTYLSVMLGGNFKIGQNKYGRGNSAIYYRPSQNSNPQNAAVLAATTLPESDKITENTSSWKTYTNNVLGLSFKYPPDWQIKSPSKTEGFDVITIDPGTRLYNMYVYVSNTDYYNLTGLPAARVKVGGLDALNSGNLLFGLQKNNRYYTFDIGYSVNKKSDFLALVHSVEIK